MSVHPGARDVLTWTVEREATVTEANAATEVVVLLDTLRMLAHQLHTVLLTLVEGVVRHPCGFGSGEGLEASRRLPKRWDPLTTGRGKRIAQRNLFPGRAKLGELHGAVERVEDLMRRYTQGRDARNGQRHTLAEDIRLAALEALLPEGLERHCQLQRSRLDTYQKLSVAVVLCAEARGYVAPKLGHVAKAQEERDGPMDLLEESDNGKDDLLPRERGRTTLAKGKEQENMVQCHRDKRTRRRFKVCVGIAGKQVINRRIAGQGHSSNRVKDNQILLVRKRCEEASQAKVEERKASPKMLEHLFGISKLEVRLRARWRRLHRRRKQTKRLARLTRLNAQRWICVQPRWHSRRS